jgi:hypothetical protein
MLNVERPQKCCRHHVLADLKRRGRPHRWAERQDEEREMDPLTIGGLSLIGIGAYNWNKKRDARLRYEAEKRRRDEEKWRRDDFQRRERKQQPGEDVRQGASVDQNNEKEPP